MRRLAVGLVATATALQVLDYGPGRNHDLVEVGTDSVYVDFDEAVSACEDQPSSAICVYASGKDRSCGDGSLEADAKRGIVKLPNELKQFDETLGRPPRIYFNHGLRLIEGFITDVPDAPIEYWGPGILTSRIVRQIGPVRITITKIPKEPTVLGGGTNYITLTEETKFEDVSKLQYGEARYANTLAIYNQGKVEGEILELPRRGSGFISKLTPVAPYLDESIEGL